MRWRSCILLLHGWLAAALSPPCAADVGAPDASLKEAVVFNLLMFVDWPEKTLPDRQDTFRFCVFDDAEHRPVMAGLDGKRMRDRTLALLRIKRDLGDLRKCQAIFVDSGNQKNLARVVAGVRDAPILVIAEGEQTLQQGAAIAISMAGGRIVFDINLAVARTANLSISSKLLRLAHTVLE